MQFYILHEDPKVSASLLPGYALRRVNLREGWQMLSDIGHVHGVTWVGQNRMYSLSHAKTMSFSQTTEDFRMFLEHYEECLNVYMNRFNRRSAWDIPFRDAKDIFIEVLLPLLPENRYHQTARYLLTRKKKHLTKEEISRLQVVYPESGPNTLPGTSDDDAD